MVKSGNFGRDAGVTNASCTSTTEGKCLYRFGGENVAPASVETLNQVLWNNTHDVTGRCCAWLFSDERGWQRQCCENWEERMAAKDASEPLAKRFAQFRDALEGDFQGAPHNAIGGW